MAIQSELQWTKTALPKLILTLDNFLAPILLFYYLIIQCIFIQYFFKALGKKCKTNIHSKEAWPQHRTVGSTLQPLSFVLMEGITTAVRCCLPCKPSFWQWVSYKRHLGRYGRPCSEIFGSSQQRAVYLSCTWLLTHFLSLDVFCFYTLCFFPYQGCSSFTLNLPSTDPHHYYHALPLSPVAHFIPVSSPPGFQIPVLMSLLGLLA